MNIQMYNDFHRLVLVIKSTSCFIQQIFSATFCLICLQNDSYINDDCIVISVYINQFNKRNVPGVYADFSKQWIDDTDWLIPCESCFNLLSQEIYSKKLIITKSCT